MQVLIAMDLEIQSSHQKLML